MLDRRRYLSTFAVLALVLLRLVVGWHFFREGSQKVAYDPHDGELRMTFSADGFLTNAKGPMAGLYRANAPDVHGWRELLATPLRNEPPAQASESTPYRDWVERIEADWRKVVDEVKAIPALSEDQKKLADEVLDARRKELNDYLAAKSDEIVAYRHELWRLANWRDAPESGEVPFVDERISTKALETAQTPSPWVTQVEQFDTQLRDDLRNLLNDEQRGAALTGASVEDALADPKADRLELINLVVTYLTIGVGICLLLGFFTRLASIVGALFLLGVILSQPPWLPDTVPTMPQVIEFAALLVLAGTGAGRWAGLDFFTYALFNRRRDAQT